MTVFESSSKRIDGGSVYRFSYTDDLVFITTITEHIEIPMVDLLEFFHHLKKEKQWKKQN